MASTEISKRYAKALLSAAKQGNVHTQVYNELKVIVDAVKADATIQAYFANPMINPDQKVAVIKAALTGKPMSEAVLNLLVLLAEKGRLGSLSSVLSSYQEFLDIEEGVTRGVVRSAQPLNSEGQREIENKISQTLKKKIVLSYEIDPKILGGVVAHVGGWTFDDSIDTHLKKLNEELNRRAN